MKSDTNQPTDKLTGLAIPEGITQEHIHFFDARARLIAEAAAESEVRQRDEAELHPCGIEKMTETSLLKLLDSFEPKADYSGGNKFIKRLLKTYSVQHVDGLIDKLAVSLRRYGSIDPDRDFSRGERKIYYSIVPDLTKRKAFIGAIAAGLLYGIPVSIVTANTMVEERDMENLPGWRGRLSNAATIAEPVKLLGEISVATGGTVFAMKDYSTARYEQVTRVLTELMKRTANPELDR